MRVAFHPLMWLSVALLAGCHSPGRTAQHVSARGTNAPMLASLPINVFSVIEATNTVPAEWLRSPQDRLLIGPGDVVEIELLGETNTLAASSVGPDGKVYYSLLPGVFIWGLTQAEAKEKLQAEAAKYLRSKPEVALSIKGVGSRRVWVLGSVTSPGLYNLGMPMTLLEAISLAGGPLIMPNSGVEQADLDNSFVLRNGQRLPVSLARLLQEGDLSQNIYMQPDDLVYLQPAGPREIYVMGAVIYPNAVPFNRDTSLATAIASAGGPLPYAALSQVAVIRGSLTHPSIATINFHRIVSGELTDVHLEAGDLVYVPFTTFRRVEMFLNYILDTFVRTVAVNEGQHAIIKNRGPISPIIPLSPLNPNIPTSPPPQ